MKWIALLGLVLAGCGGSHAASPAPRKHYPVFIRQPVVLPAPRLGLRNLPRFVSPTRLAIATVGSSSCPSVPDELVVLTPHRIRIHLTVGSWENGRPVAHPPSGGVCTADYGTTQMVLAIDPKLIDVHRPLTVRFFYNDSKKPLVRIAAPLSG